MKLEQDVSMSVILYNINYNLDAVWPSGTSSWLMISSWFTAGFSYKIIYDDISIDKCVKYIAKWEGKEIFYLKKY